MTKISIIVPIYKVEKYISLCLDSLLNQTLQEIEIICIDDASPDCSGDILKEYEKKDGRIKVIELPENKGTLHARICGTKAATGQYLMFVDSDDYLENDACEELYHVIEMSQADVVHFGTFLHTGENVSENMKDWVEHFLTPYEGKIENETLLDACFVDDKFDFNITNKIWRRTICVDAFSMAESVRLVSSEDRYIFFLLAYFAKSYLGTEKKYYHYNLGIGVTGGDKLSLEQFEKRCSGVLASKLVDSFLSKIEEREQYANAFKQFGNKILWDCVDCWYNKLEEEDYEEGFQILRKYFATNELVNAIARVYFERGEEIYKRANLQRGKRVAIFYRYLGDDNMDVKIIQHVHVLKQRGYQVCIYTDCDRKDVIGDRKYYDAEIVYLPDSLNANWDKYELRCNEFYEQLKKDEIGVLLYASPTSHIYLLDTLLATLSNITVVDLNDEVYLEEIKKEKYRKTIHIAQKIRGKFRKIRAMLRGF